MTPHSTDPSSPYRIPRRDLLALAAAAGPLGLAAAAVADDTPTGQKPRQAPRKKPDGQPHPKMKKSINLWAFPYPQQWTLKECFELARDAGFDAVEINFDEQGEFSAESSDEDLRRIGKLAADSGIAISGVCSFLFWPYALTANDPEKREKGVRLATRMVEAARLVGTDNLLVVPGAVYIPWLPEEEPVPNDVCLQRARHNVKRLIPAAEKAGVTLNMENIFANGFLFSPQEMASFVDSFNSPHVKVHFDTGNIMEYQFPEHWVKQLGQRIRNIHFKEWDKRTHEFNLHTFRTLLDGTTNWPAVIDALGAIGYEGYLTFEYFHPFQHYPEVLVYQTSEALDWMLGRA
jgi:L-ribulose-5-phosphate 3-epimerase